MGHYFLDIQYIYFCRGKYLEMKHLQTSINKSINIHSLKRNKIKQNYMKENNTTKKCNRGRTSKLAPLTLSGPVLFWYHKVQRGRYPPSYINPYQNRYQILNAGQYSTHPGPYRVKYIKLSAPFYTAQGILPKHVKITPTSIPTGEYQTI